MLIIATGTVASVLLLSGIFWLIYGGDWHEILKLGCISFVLLVPSELRDYSQTLSLSLALLYWPVFLAVVYATAAFISQSKLTRKHFAYVAVVVPAWFIYAGCYWLTVLAFRAITCFYLPPFRYF